LTYKFAGITQPTQTCYLKVHFLDSSGKDIWQTREGDWDNLSPLPNPEIKDFITFQLHAINVIARPTEAGGSGERDGPSRPQSVYAGSSVRARAPAIPQPPNDRRS